MAGDAKWAPGQRVFEPGRGWSGRPGRILTIDRVTPSGRAVIGPYQYDPGGRKLGERYGDRIVPLTDEHLSDIALWERQREARSLAEKIKWGSLDDEELNLALPALRALAGAAQ